MLGADIYMYVCVFAVYSIIKDGASKLCFINPVIQFTVLQLYTTAEEVRVQK